ncbi:M20 family metallopeptidase [Haloarchaeobius salinus]|uniref:M20 family metallopeptidase n=1 Tax=Haloarchaeobius salinus TaxID=1198298 RepID=UPI00210DE0A3|nr:M20/M25/M40 family metallo-hydrolase [Haloarchaeobius salinus]
MNDDESTTRSESSTDAARRVAAAVDADETIDLIQSLVRIESPYFQEDEIGEFVYGWLDDRGLDPEYHSVSEPEITDYEGRNVLVRLSGSDPDAPTLMLNGHMDTVELVDEWTEDPLSGRIEDGRLYGQGAADMKAGLAAAMVAVATLSEADVDLAGDVVLAAVVDEEGPYGLGTDQLLRDGIADDCDMAVVTEPGPILDGEGRENPTLYLGARGRFLYDIEVRGTAAHASTPDAGRNAVVAAGQLADALSKMPVGSHPLLGEGSVCPLSIDGGGETLSVPESCRLLVDRHVVPGETRESVLADAEEVVAELGLDADVSVGLREVPHADARYGPYVFDEHEPLVQGLAAATRTVTGESPSLGYFRSVGDFNYLGHRAEVPTVIFGPDGDQIHGAGEWVDLDETVDVARVLAAGAVELLS